MCILIFICLFNCFGLFGLIVDFVSLNNMLFEYFVKWLVCKNLVYIDMYFVIYMFDLFFGICSDDRVMYRGNFFKSSLVCIIIDM